MNLGGNIDGVDMQETERKGIRVGFIKIHFMPI